MAWPATERYGLNVVPGELGLVQDFLNTIEEGSNPKPDLLEDLDSARDWAAGMRREWLSLTGDHSLSHLTALDEPDRQRLIALRTRLFRSLFSDDATVLDGDDAGAALRTELVLGAGGVTLRGHAAGWDAYEFALLTTLYRAGIGGETRRMKTCKNDDCNIVFYDRSPNNSAAWHDVRTCGNRANVRAHRSRAARV